MEKEQEVIIHVEDAREEQKKQKMGLKKAAFVFLSTISIGTLTFFSGSSNTQSGANFTRGQVESELESQGLSENEVEKILDEAEKEANERQGILGADTKETHGMAMANAQGLTEKMLEAEKEANERQGILGADNREKSEIDIMNVQKMAENMADIVADAFYGVSNENTEEISTGRSR